MDSIGDGLKWLGFWIFLGMCNLGSCSVPSIHINEAKVQELFGAEVNAEHK